MNKSFTATLFSLLILSISVNAWATPPVSDTYYGTDDFAIVGCGDYDVRTSAYTKYTETLFFDRDDNPVRLRVSLHVEEAVYYNSLNPDIYIKQGMAGAGENFQFMVDLLTGVVRQTGLPFRITLPGIGPLYLEAGHGILDGENLSWNGISIFPEAGTGSALCEALAP